MVLAMDRLPKPIAQASLIGLGLALGLLDLGCARLGSFRKTPEPAVLGRVSDTSDIYAMSRRPGSTPVDASTPNRPEINQVAESRPEAVPTVDDISSKTAPASDPDLRLRSNNATGGVPNASLTLASHGRRSSNPTPTEIVSQAREALDSMTNYEVSLHRQERVNGTLLPEEDVVVAIRREPRAVRLSWPSGSNQGREVLYRADEPGRPMHVKMANPALPRLTLAPESPMVMRNSRHPVTEAGLDSIVEGLENALASPEASNLIYVGLESTEGFNQLQPYLQRTSPSGDLWRIYFDPVTHLPSVVQAKNPAGDLLENYQFRNVRPNLAELSAAEAFDANARWGQPKGLFGRLARGESTEPAETPR